jgi:hypothetical protein
MKAAISSAVVAVSMSLTALAPAAAAPADAKVVIKKDAQFMEESTDALLRRESATRLRSVLEKELKSVAPNCLKEGQTLELALAEVNSAGSMASAGANTTRTDVRVVKNSWVIALNFDYRLVDADKKVLDQGSANLRDSGFVGSDPAERIVTESYPKERALLNQWFRTKYCAAGTSKSP